MTVCNYLNPCSLISTTLGDTVNDEKPKLPAYMYKKTYSPRYAAFFFRNWPMLMTAFSCEQTNFIILRYDKSATFLLLGLEVSISYFEGTHLFL